MTTWVGADVGKRMGREGVVGQANVRARRTSTSPMGCKSCAARSATQGKDGVTRGRVRRHRCTRTSWRNSPCVNWHVRALLPTPPLPITIRRSDILVVVCGRDRACFFNLLVRIIFGNSVVDMISQSWFAPVGPRAPSTRRTAPSRLNARNLPRKAVFRPKPALRSPPRSLFRSPLVKTSVHVRERA